MILINQSKFGSGRLSKIVMKKILLYSVLTIVNFSINFIIYNWSFNVQATPYLTEEQRVESGLMMLSTTIPAYFFSAAVIALVFFLVSKKH